MSPQNRITDFPDLPVSSKPQNWSTIPTAKFVREEVGSKYGRNGQVSVDPVVLMKMMLLLLLDDVKSERKLRHIIPLRLDYLYFLGYGLAGGHGAQSLGAFQGSAALGQHSGNSPSTFHK